MSPRSCSCLPCRANAVFALDASRPCFHRLIHDLGVCVSVLPEIQHMQGPDWSRNPSGLGESRNFGSQVDRHTKKGSPVVPGSLQKIMEDSESVLYTVTVLRSMYEVRSDADIASSEFSIGDAVNVIIRLGSFPSHSVSDRLGTTRAGNSSRGPKSTSSSPSPGSCARSATACARTSPSTRPSRARAPWSSNSSRWRWTTCARD